jgi:hypothetical protein
MNLKPEGGMDDLHLFCSDAPGYMIRDQDRIYGGIATPRLYAMGIRDKSVEPASPCRMDLPNV